MVLDATDGKPIDFAENPQQFAERGIVAVLKTSPPVLADIHYQRRRGKKFSSQRISESVAATTHLYVAARAKSFRGRAVYDSEHERAFAGPPQRYAAVAIFAE